MRVRTIVVILAGAVPFAGCGVGSKEPSPAPPAQTLPAGAPAAAPVAGGGQPVPAVTGKRGIVYVIDTIRSTGPDVVVEGWAFLDADPANPKKPLDARNSEIHVVLGPPNGAPAMFVTNKVRRPDITKVYGPNLDESGFSAVIPKASLGRGTYRIGLYVRRANEEALAFSDKTAVVD